MNQNDIVLSIILLTVTEEIKPSARIREIINEFNKSAPAQDTHTYTAYSLEAILKYLDEQAAQCSGECKPSEPSKCEHEWKIGTVLIGNENVPVIICKKCEMHVERSTKPSDSGGEREKEYQDDVIALAICLHECEEVEEPSPSFEELPHSIQRDFCQYAARLLKKGYSKHPKSNELVSLNKEELLGVVAQGWCTNQNKDKCMDAGLAMGITEAVYNHFSQPKAKVMSVEELQILIIKHTECEGGCVAVENTYEAAQAIHTAMVKQNENPYSQT